MKRFTVVLVISGILGLLLFTSCEKDTSSALSETQLEEQSIEEIVTDENIEESDYLADWGIDDGNEDNMYNGFSTFSPGEMLTKSFTSINNVVRFGRKLNRRIPRTIIIRRLSPDSILVHMERIWAGGFFTIENLSDSGFVSGDTFVVNRKQLIHTVRRSAIFTPRYNDEAAMENSRNRWKLSAVSLTEGNSRPAPTVNLHQVQVRSSNGTFFQIENPLRTIWNIPDDLPVFVQGETVVVRALVSNSTSNPVIDPQTGSTETVLLHFGINRFHRARKQFEFAGTDPVTGYHIYEGRWTVHEPALRPFHAVIDVIDNGTIYESDEQTYPYNSTTWGLPYRVGLAQ